MKRSVSTAASKERRGGTDLILHSGSIISDEASDEAMRGLIDDLIVPMLVDEVMRSDSESSEAKKIMPDPPAP